LLSMPLTRNAAIPPAARAISKTTMRAVFIR
jgi:hypothetical protein